MNTLCVLTVLSPASTAQPVLTDAGINPSIGDVYTLRSGNYLSPGNAGAGQAWDLSAMTTVSTASYNVNALALAPSASQFTATSNLQMNNGTIYNFFHAGSAAYRNSGYIAGSTVTIVYSDAEDVLRYPFGFNDNFSDNFLATFTLSNIAFTRSGTTSVSYDGWGSLQLPTRLFSNVARVHLIQNYSDVSAFNTTTYSNDQYLWFVNGHHQALAGVFSTLVNGSLASQGGFYSADTSLLIGLQDAGQEFFHVSAFPNPASTEISFSTGGSRFHIQQVEVFDPSGNLVLIKGASADQRRREFLTISLDGLASGIYLVKITAGNGLVRRQKVSLIK